MFPNVDGKKKAVELNPPKLPAVCSDVSARAAALFPCLRLELIKGARTLSADDGGDVFSDVVEAADSVFKTSGALNRNQT